MIRQRQSVLFTLPLILVFLLSAVSFSQSDLEKIRARTQAQNGTLSGTVADKRTGEAIIGANIHMTGTKLGTSTDIEGAFTVTAIPPGIYTVRISFLGYRTDSVTGVPVTPERNEPLRILLTEDDGVQQQEVLVSASAITSGEGAMLAERRNGARIGDGISAEQMKKAPDATSGDALRRVTGVTLVDNKFVFVRGVTDRYNQTTLNGAPVTSTSVDKKSFSFDMLPSNLLDNMNVTKTASPDLPGDFTGGLIQIKTLDIPEQRSLKASLGGSWNSMTTFRDFHRSQGSPSDWTGTDGGLRQFPGSSGGELGARLPNSWASRRSQGPVAQSFSLSAGDRIGTGEGELGVIAALTYRTNYQRTEVGIREFGGGQLRRNVNGTSDKVSVLWGGILDLSYGFGDRHRVSMKNNYNRSAEDKVYLMSGYKADDDENIRTYQTEWEQRGIYSGQFTGDHRPSEWNGATVDWMVNFSEARTAQPDRKELVYAASPYSDQPMSAKPGERSWGSIYERSAGQSFNILMPVGGFTVKGGAANERRAKNFSMQFYQVSSNGLAAQNFPLTTYGIDSIYRPEHFGPGLFSMVSFSNSSGAFDAAQDLRAAYLMADVPFLLDGHRFRFSGGLRMESVRQEIATQQGRLGAGAVTSLLEVTNILPSTNLTYMVDERQNIRAAYSHTVNRPEFRERSAFYFYDFDRSEYVRGNPLLQRALIRNYDLRYEFFPSFGDLFAASYFYKALSTPIEESRTFTSFVERTWINAPQGKNYGWEFEFRKNLGFASEYLMLSSVSANYTRIISSVPFRENKGNSSLPEIVEGERQMQGQSPYMYNISITFVEPAYGTSVHLLYNEYGSRIDAVGDVRAGDGDVYEQRRGTVDLSIAQPLGSVLKGLEWKFSAKNLNNQPIVFTQGRDVYRTNRVGTGYSMQFAYSY